MGPLSPRTKSMEGRSADAGRRQMNGKELQAAGDCCLKYILHVYLGK